jgi:hypothetical protein
MTLPPHCAGDSIICTANMCNVPVKLPGPGPVPRLERRGQNTWQRAAHDEPAVPEAGQIHWYLAMAHIRL